jgi:RNA polymerase sigma-70 factor, ECF subfamily
MTDSEGDLIKRAQADDTDAFCLLAQRYTRRIYLLAFHYCRNAQDAEDLSQEAWLKAYQALRSFRCESSFYTWLRRIIINTFLNHQRSKTPVVESFDVDHELTTESRVTSPETLYNKVLFETVMNALAELTPSQRLVFLLRHYEGMTYDEIANAMNCSSGTVKKSVSRATGKLRARLDVEREKPDESLTGLAPECEGVWNA